MCVAPIVAARAWFKIISMGWTVGKFFDFTQFLFFCSLILWTKHFFNNKHTLYFYSPQGRKKNPNPETVIIKLHEVATLSRTETHHYRLPWFPRWQEWQRCTPHPTGRWDRRSKPAPGSMLTGCIALAKLFNQLRTPSFIINKKGYLPFYIKGYIKQNVQESIVNYKHSMESGCHYFSSPQYCSGEKSTHLLLEFYKIEIKSWT